MKNVIPVPVTIVHSIVTNPLAPKVPRRDSLAAKDANGQTSTASVHRTEVSYNFCRSTQHRPNGPVRSDMAAEDAAASAPFGATVGQQAQLGPNQGPLGSNLAPTWPQLNLGPTCRNLAPSWSRLGTTSAGVEIHMASEWATWPAQSKIHQTPVLHCPHVMSPLGPTCCEAAVKGPKVHHFGHDSNFHVRHMASMWDQSGSLWAQLQRQMPTQNQGSHAVGASWPEFGASYAQIGRNWALVRPNLWPRTAKFDPSRLVVGPSRPASFLSVLFPVKVQNWVTPCVHIIHWYLLLHPISQRYLNGQDVIQAAC